MNLFKQFPLMAPEGGDAGAGGGGGAPGAGGGDQGAGGGQPGAGGQPSGGGAQDWRASLPEDIRNNPALEPFKDVAGLAKSYIGVQPLIGADKLVVPKPDAPKEAWDEFYTKLGRPKEPTGYDFKEALPQDRQIPDEMVQKWRDTAFKLNLTKSQAAEFVKARAEEYLSEMDSVLSSVVKEHEEGLKALRQKWGAALDQEVALAREGAEWAGGEELLKLFDENGWGNIPAVVEAFNKIGHALQEDVLAGSFQSGARKGAMTPQQAQAKIAELQRDPAYMNNGDPRHATLIQEIAELTKFAYPEDAKQIAVAPGVPLM